MKQERTFHISVDTGGTFTDLIAVDNQAKTYRKKILSNASIRGQVIDWKSPTELYVSENWELSRDFLPGFIFATLGKEGLFEATVKTFDIANGLLTISDPIPANLLCKGCPFALKTGEEAPVLATRMVTETALDESLPAIHMRLGSTRGTNALLEHKGAPTAFFITAGFRDLLQIGTQQRPDIFSLNIHKRKPLPQTIIELNERIDAKGNVLQPFKPEDYKDALHKLREQGIASLAVALLNAYKNPEHERAFRELAEAEGFRYISCSSELSPLIKILERAETSTVNAYLAPVIDTYLEQVTGAIGNNLLVMNSAGGLVKADAFYPKDSLLSGPAGGVVGAAAIGKEAGCQKLITFDMGGTSTDVSRYDGAFDYRYELEIGDARVYSPAIEIETVAAGGGSICGFDGFKLTVGPESAGADPGPACYGAGGPLALTDVNLLLGRLDSSRFGIPVKPESAGQRLNELLATMNSGSLEKYRKEQVLTGYLEIANEIMAGAIKKISTSKGFDPAEYTLLAFGGAGGMHACGIARLLNIRQIIIPADAGLLSAYGIGTAKVERFGELQVLQPLDEFFENATVVFEQLITDVGNRLRKEMGEDLEVETQLQVAELRFVGQDSTLPIDWQSEKERVIESFKEKYSGLFGHWVENRHIEVESVRIKISLEKGKSSSYNFGKQNKSDIASSRNIRVWDGSHWTRAEAWNRESLVPGSSINGFAIVSDDKSTTVVEKGWKAEVDKNHNLLLELLSSEKSNIKADSQAAATKLELFTNRFMSVAANMGAVLQRTALSVNIKERLDFSCALLDANGYLVANAPHIPVHLGSLGICVRTLLQHIDFSEGDTVVTNHPYFGGSHLPDVTMVTPVFFEGRRIAFVVNRAHHAEIGGISPGSMPPAARNLAQEGVTIPPHYLVKKGKTDWTGMRKILTDAPYPSRLLEENLADLNAALAANYEGSNTFLAFVRQFGPAEVRHFMTALRKYAAGKMHKVLEKIEDGNYTAEEFLDDGTPIRVKIIKQGREVKVDFSGSGDVHPQNMNATPAIVHSVVIYVMRLMLDEDIPLNDGLMEPVSIILPEGFLNPPFDRAPEACPAVVGGNVEVSQRLTDTLLKALGMAACSQGTMNNVLFGNQSFGYYETICGGTGATEGFPGASAVHQHMTNTRITDPEVIEHRFPVQINSFGIRQGSGGNGLSRGGDGVVRSYTFLEEVELSLLSQHRREGPYGMDGGRAGATGKQWIVRADGSREALQGIDQVKLKKGDTFVIETPGGGGVGSDEL